MDHYEIVKKLIGEIEPVGSSHVDGRRLENLKAWSELVECMVSDLLIVSKNKNRYEQSMKDAGDRAVNTLRNIDSLIDGFDE